MISVTALSSHEYCPRKLYLEKVLRLVSDNKAALIRGSLHHECLETLNNAEERLVRSVTAGMAFPDVVELFVRYGVDVSKGSFEAWRDKAAAAEMDLDGLFQELSLFVHNESRARARDVFSFRELHGDIFGDALWAALSPKKESERWIALEDVGMRGIIDCILQYDDGQLIPVEYKTGKAPREGVWPGHKLQVGAYALMMEREFGIDVPYGVVRYVDWNKQVKVPVNAAFKDEILRLISEVQQLLESPSVPGYCSSPRKCESCSFREQCYDEEFIAARLKKVQESPGKIDPYVVT